MKNKQSNTRLGWFVITGGPSCGKTTVLKLLAAKGYATVAEAARSVIDEAITRGITTEELRSDEKHFQELVAQRKAEIELSLDENEIIFFDRGMHDTLAYLQAYDFAVEQRVENLLNSAQYAGVFLLEPLPHFTRDYARTEDQAFARRIHDLLAQAYTNYGMKPIPVKVASPNERVQCIIDRVKGELR